MFETKKYFTYYFLNIFLTSDFFNSNKMIIFKIAYI